MNTPAPTEEPLENPPPETEITPSIPAKPAWSPTAIAWFCVLFTILPAGIMYALNFDRLGQPEKRRSAFLFVCIAAFLFYFLVFYVGGLIENDPKLDRYYASFRLWSLIISAGCAWYFYLRQQSLFVKHLKQGGRKASLITPLLLIFLCIVILGVSLTSFFEFQQAQLNKEFDTALSLVNNGEDRQAEAIFKSYKLKDPASIAVRYNLADIYIRSERYPLARQELREILRLEPDDKAAREMLKNIDSLKNLDR